MLLTNFPALLAMAPGAGGGGNAYAQFIPLVLIFVIFWALIIRPQQRKAKAHRKMVAELRKGDSVCTAAGIFGVVQKVQPDYIQLEIAPKVVVRMLKTQVAELSAPRAEDPAPAASTPEPPKAEAKNKDTAKGDTPK